MFERSERFYDIYGWWSVVIACSIPWVRTFVPPIAGTVKMKYYKFLSDNALGTLLWGAGITWQDFIPVLSLGLKTFHTLLLPFL